MVIGRGSQFADSEMARYLAPFMGVSRSHLWIGRDDDAVLLLDLGSKNGTWTNTGRVLPFTLKRLKQDQLPAQIRLGANLVLELTGGSTT
jgi:pSer/pThr/pTyr-binding forkhead associated (FHA) protein